ncbi:MAG: GAF domain-containing protein [Desulfonatronovibrionaceae bacterium]
MTANCLDRILGIVSSVFDAYSTVLVLRETQDEYVIANYFSLGDHISTDSRIRPGTGLAGWILRNQKPLLINNFDREVSCLGYYQPAGESKIKAFMGCPLSAGEGVLCVDSKKTYSFSDKDQKVLHQFVLLVETLRTGLCEIDATRRKETLFDCLRLILGLRSNFPRWDSYIKELLAVLIQYAGFSCSFIATRDETGSGFFLESQTNLELKSRIPRDYKFNINSGLVGWVFKNSTPVFSSEKKGVTKMPLFGKEVHTPEFASLVCLPLVVCKKTRGVLVLADHEDVDCDRNLKSFLLMVADYLALFLENLYLRSRL